jgi:peptidoglycan lytic transglycosylase
MFRAAAPYLGPRESCAAPPGLVATGQTLRGEASWYGPGFVGNNTASGAVFDPARFTVAHKTLPFGLFLLIRHRGRCVVSLVNDRGPYVGDRILDLSDASAKAVGLGVGDVDAAVYVRG